MKVNFTETVLRDANQSLIATRMPFKDFAPVLEKLDKAGYYSLECWGGETFDSCLRYLNEDPWERLRKIKAACPNTKLQMLLRGQNLLGYKHYPDDVVRMFVRKSVEIGKKIGVRICSFGHAGDGNLHIYACKDNLTDDVWEKSVEQVMDELYIAAKEMGGEVSGEHGIGHAKKGFLAESMGETQMNLMRGIKAAFDPKGILNPGKVVG